MPKPLPACRCARPWRLTVAAAPRHPRTLSSFAPAVGLLYHQSSLVINEHYTDTGGFSDHVFSMCRLPGFRFAPRIRDLKEKRLYLLPGMTAPPEFSSLVTGAIDVQGSSNGCRIPTCVVVATSASIRASSKMRFAARYS